MFGSIGMPELIIIFVIALIIFGPRKLPELGKSLGKSISEFKRASNELRSTLEEEIRIDEQRQKPAAAPISAVSTAPLSSVPTDAPVETEPTAVPVETEPTAAPVEPEPTAAPVEPAATTDAAQETRQG